MANNQNIFNQNCEINDQTNITGEQITVTINKHYDKTKVQVNESIDFHVPKLSKSFRGRDEELQTLQKWFFIVKHKLAVICGCPGYGKSELAKQFVRHCKDKVTHVLWMDAETPDRLLRSFRDLARLLHIPDVDEETQLYMLYQLLKPKPTIIVFDNATCRKDIVKFVPEGDNACICLVTSHVQDWNDDVPSLPLAPLSMDASLDVLRDVLQHRFQDEDVGLYQQLANLLSRVPLALQVAAAYVRQEFDDLDEHFHLCEYVERLQVPSELVLDQPLPDSSANTYEKTFLKAMQISLHKIQNSKHQQARLACDILDICAYLDSEKILFSDLLNIPYLKEILKNNQNPTIELKRACALLRNYLFISYVKDRITIHNLIQSSIVLNQNYVLKNNKNKFYIACLEFLLFNTENSNYHRQSILKYANYHLNTYKIFYVKYKAKILSGISFSRHLIIANCKIFLKEILNDLGSDNVKLINSRYLLHEAVINQQHELLDFLLDYKPNINLRNEQDETCLHLATYKIDLLAIKKLVSHKADVNAIGGMNLTVLHRLVYKSGAPYNIHRFPQALEALRWLVAQGARVDVVGWRGKTLLHMAAIAHSADIIAHLVKDFKQEVNAVDENKQTALFKLCDVSGIDRSRVVRTASCLLKLNACIDCVDVWGRTPVENARSAGLEYLAAFLENPTQPYYHVQISQVDSLIVSVTSGDAQSLTRQLDELGESALQIANEAYLLHMAARHNKQDVLLTLLSRGVAVDNRDDSDNTALFDCAWELNVNIMRDLVTHGADVNATNIGRRFVLHSLIGGAGLMRRLGRGAEECEALRWLVQAGAHVDSVTSDGATLLHMATWALSVDLVRCLITEYGADVHVTDNDGETPLFNIIAGLQFFQASEAKGVSVAACLLKFGTRCDAVNTQGLTAAQVARSKGLNEFAAFLDNPDKKLENNINTGEIRDNNANELKYKCTQKLNRASRGRSRSRRK